MFFELIKVIQMKGIVWNNVSLVVIPLLLLFITETTNLFGDAIELQILLLHHSK